MSKKVPLTDQAYRTIKDMIINLQFRPGEVLLAQQLVNQLNTSRTPIREAFVKLVKEGLMQQTDSRKFQVSMVTKSSIIDLYEVRECLEVTALHKTFDGLDDADVLFFQKNQEQMKNALDTDDFNMFFQLDSSFHMFFIQRYDNKFLTTFMNQLMDQQQRIRYITASIENRMCNTIWEHQEIIAGILNRDAEATANAIKFHLNAVQQEMVKMVEHKDFAQFIQMHAVK